MTTTKIKIKGFKKPKGARKSHAFDEDGDSLCGKWEISAGVTCVPEQMAKGLYESKLCKECLKIKDK